MLGCCWQRLSRTVLALSKRQCSQQWSCDSRANRTKGALQTSVREAPLLRAPLRRDVLTGSHLYNDLSIPMSPSLCACTLPQHLLSTLCSLSGAVYMVCGYSLFYGDGFSYLYLPSGVVRISHAQCLVVRFVLCLLWYQNVLLKLPLDLCSASLRHTLP